MKVDQRQTNKQTNKQTNRGSVDAPTEAGGDEPCPGLTPTESLWLTQLKKWISDGNHLKCVPVDVKMSRMDCGLRASGHVSPLQLFIALLAVLERCTALGLSQEPGQ